MLCSPDQVKFDDKINEDKDLSHQLKRSDSIKHIDSEWIDIPINMYVAQNNKNHLIELTIFSIWCHQAMTHSPTIEVNTQGFPIVKWAL